VPRAHLYPASPAAPGFTLTRVSLPQTREHAEPIPSANGVLPPPGPTKISTTSPDINASIWPEDQKECGLSAARRPSYQCTCKAKFPCFSRSGETLSEMSWLSLLRGSDFSNCTNTGAGRQWRRRHHIGRVQLAQRQTSYTQELASRPMSRNHRARQEAARRAGEQASKPPPRDLPMDCEWSTTGSHVPSLLGSGDVGECMYTTLVSWSC
jgi:hypothetical protein